MSIPSSNNRQVIPNLAELLSRRMRDISARINCHTIGKIISFNASNQTAVISLNLLTVLKGVDAIGDTGLTSDYTETLPATLVDVPIVFLQGGSSYLTFPIAVGDSCILLFCDRDIDNWLNAGVVAAPNSERVHNINDAIAIVGIRNFQNSLPNYNTQIMSASDQTGERFTQAGFLQPYAGSTAPSGWMLCYGQAISRVTYSILFAIIGTTYGAGNGSTTFNLPDLRGRTVAGLDNMGGSNANVLTNTYNPNRNTLGGATGEEAHQLSIPELPAHTHTVSSRIDGSINLGGDHYDTDNGNLNSVVTGSTGSNTAHQNVQPSLMVNWIIKL